nr:hypothetical protein [Tanacetum cinerariifolium]
MRRWRCVDGLVVLWRGGSECKGDVDGVFRGVVVAVWRWRGWGNGGDVGFLPESRRKVNTPRCDEDRLELMELTVFLLPSDEKVGIEVSAVDLQVNDVMRLQALVDKKNVIITEATIRDDLRLDDAEGVECLPNEEIFTELARMGYEKPSTKLTFYKAFFSSQWKFLIHTILQCMSAKRTSWNEFSSSMASLSSAYLQVENLTFQSDLSSHTTKYSSPALTHKVFKNMRRVGKGCSRVETPLFEGMIVEQQVGEGAAEVSVEDVSTAGVAAEGAAASVAEDEVLTAIDEPSIPSPPPPTPPPQPSQVIPLTSQVRIIADIYADKDVTLKDVVAKDVQDAEIKESLYDVDLEPVELQEVVEVVTTAKLITEKEGNAMKRYQALKRKPETETQARKNMMIYLRNVAGFKMDYFKGITYDDTRPIFEKYFNSNVAFLQKTKEHMEEEDSRALKRLSESQEDKASKKQKLDEEVEELKRHHQIVPNDEDDVYTEATPLALKVPVVDYEIYIENNKPYYKIKRANGSHQLYLNFFSMLKNFDREDLEVL